MSKTIYEILEETNPSYMDIYYSPCFGNCKVKLIGDGNLRKIYIYITENNNIIKGLYLDENGKLNPEGNCLISPANKESTWIGFYKGYLRSKYKVGHPMMFSMDGYEWTYGKFDLHKTCKIPYKGKKVTPSYMVPLEQFDFTNDYLIKNTEKSII